MTMTLTAVGDKLGLLLDRPTLDKLGIDEATPLIVTSDADGLHIRPVLFARPEAVEAAAREFMTEHAETLTRLAQRILASCVSRTFSRFRHFNWKRMGDSRDFATQISSNRRSCSPWPTSGASISTRTFS